MHSLGPVRSWHAWSGQLGMERHVDSTVVLCCLHDVTHNVARARSAAAHSSLVFNAVAAAVTVLDTSEPHTTLTPEEPVAGAANRNTDAATRTMTTTAHHAAKVLFARALPGDTRVAEQTLATERGHTSYLGPTVRVTSICGAGSWRRFLP